MPSVWCMMHDPPRLRRSIDATCKTSMCHCVSNAAGTQCAAGGPFHVSPVHSRLINVPLAQTGEGIKECELISWHVKVPSVPYCQSHEKLMPALKSQEATISTACRENTISVNMWELGWKPLPVEALKPAAAHISSWWLSTTSPATPTPISAS